MGRTLVSNGLSGFPGVGHERSHAAVAPPAESCRRSRASSARRLRSRASGSWTPSDVARVGREARRPRARRAPRSSTRRVHDRLAGHVTPCRAHRRDAAGARSRSNPVTAGVPGHTYAQALGGSQVAVLDRARTEVPVRRATGASEDPVGRDGPAGAGDDLVPAPTSTASTSPSRRWISRAAPGAATGGADSSSAIQRYPAGR